MVHSECLESMQLHFMQTDRTYLTSPSSVFAVWLSNHVAHIPYPETYVLVHYSQFQYSIVSVIK